MGVTELGEGWLGSLDSNQERMIQSHLCCHYTTSQLKGTFKYIILKTQNF